jgi:hypothetical protein
MDHPFLWSLLFAWLLAIQISFIFMVLYLCRSPLASLQSFKHYHFFQLKNSFHGFSNIIPKWLQCSSNSRKSLIPPQCNWMNLLNYGFEVVHPRSWVWFLPCGMYFWQMKNSTLYADLWCTCTGTKNCEIYLWYCPTNLLVLVKGVHV